jgi:hypothetical protein
MGKKKVPVWWHPVKNSELKNSVEDLGSFFTPQLRDQFELSKAQADDILEHLKNGTVFEKNQAKFFKVKKFLEDALYTEMNIADTPFQFETNFPPGSDSWGNNEICCGATSSGKTWHIKERCKRNLDGPKRDRRRFLWFSSEFDSDASLKEMKKDKYNEYFSGKEISDAAVKDSEHDNAQDFFDYEIAMKWDNAPPGTVAIFDDPVDSAQGLQIPIRNLINRALRVSRHARKSICFILHRIRSGSWSVQGSNSCKYFTIFPRSQKGKCCTFLRDEMGLTLREARRNVADFGATGRACTVQLFSPNALIGPKLIRLI